MFILSLTPAKTKLLHRTFLRGDEINHLGTGTQLIRRVIDLGLYEDGVPFRLRSEQSAGAAYGVF